MHWQLPPLVQLTQPSSISPCYGTTCSDGKSFRVRCAPAAMFSKRPAGQGEAPEGALLKPSTLRAQSPLLDPVAVLLCLLRPYRAIC